MIITVHAKPGAKQNSLIWLDENTAKISVTAQAEKGKANEAVIELLAEELDMSKSRLTLIRGATTRIKQIEVT